MSNTWSSRLGSLGRFSPFGGRGDPAPKVQDSDFSYITPDELDVDTSRAPPGEHRPKKDTDVLVFKYQRTSYPVHFAAYAIDDGDLTVSAAREAVAKKIGIDPRRIRLFWKGKKLDDNRRTLYTEGLRSRDQADILTILGDAVDDEEDGSDSGDGEDAGSGSQRTAGGKKKRKNRKRKSKKSTDSDSGASTPVAEHLPIPSGTHPLHRETNASAAQRAPSPNANVANTPQAKLQALVDKLRNELVPLCEEYIRHPPAEKEKRNFEHKKLTETILAQVVLKTDAVETEGNEDARAMRKGLVREAQEWFNRLDEAQAKGS